MKKLLPSDFILLTVSAVSGLLNFSEKNSAMSLASMFGFSTKYLATSCFSHNENWLRVRTSCWPFRSLSALGIETFNPYRVKNRWANGFFKNSRSARGKAPRGPSMYEFSAPYFMRLLITCTVTPPYCTIQKKTMSINITIIVIIGCIILRQKIDYDKQKILK